MRQLVEQARGKPGYEDRLLAEAANTEAFHGRFVKAHDFKHQTWEAAEWADGNDRVPSYMTAAAWGEAEAAHSQVAAALKMNSARYVKETSATALAAASDIAGAEKLADELEERYRLDTRIQNYIIPTIRAQNMLQQGRAAEAVQMPQKALAIELSTGDATQMEATYVRGMAYLQLHNPSGAVAEFQKMIDHPGIVENFVAGALAHLQLAHADLMSGKVEAGRTEYQTLSGSVERCRS